MGFDLYGMNPQTNTSPPIVTDWDDKDAVMAYHDYQHETPGAYFRANVRFWRPIWSFVCGSCDDILTERDIEAGSYNDGHKISKTKAKRIAARLRKLDKKGTIQVWEDSMNVFIEEAKEHNKIVQAKMDKISEQCKSKHGYHLVPAEYPEPYKTQWNNAQQEEEFGSHYPASRNEIMRFSEFCEQSGGFEIC